MDSSSDENVTSLRFVVDRAAAMLDPPPPQILKPLDLAQVYDDVLTGLSQNQQVLHPRAVSLLHWHAKKSHSCRLHQEDWMEVQVDAIRALLVSSFLLLELCPTEKSKQDQNDLILNQESRHVLERTIQRCTILLRVLACAFDGKVPEKKVDHKNGGDLQPEKLQLLLDQLPPCRYPILQSAVQELPLLQSCMDNGEWMSPSRHDADESLLRVETTNEESDQESDDALVVLTSKQQLVEAEEVLWNMAQMPIPNPSKHTLDFARQGPMILVTPQQHDKCEAVARLVKNGIFLLEKSSTQLHPLPILYYSLSSASTCRLGTKDSPNNTSCQVVLENVNPISTNTTPKPKHTTFVTLLVPSGLVEAHAWINTISRVISTTMTRQDQVQKELVLEWGYQTYKECYNAAMAVQTRLAE